MTKRYKGWNAVEQIVKDFRKDYKKEKPKLLKQLAANILDMIQVRIVEGYGVGRHGGKKMKIKPLKASTIKAREKKKLASFTAFDFSNQVETGKFVKGLRVVITKDTIYIRPSKDREDMAAAQELNGRPTLYLSQEELDEITQQIEEWLLELWDD